MQTNRGPLRKWKKKIGKADDDEYNTCMVEERGHYAAFECPLNEDLRREHINGAQSWEDLEDEVKVREGE